MLDENSDDDSGDDDDGDKRAKMAAIARSPRFKKKCGLAGGNTFPVFVGGPIQFRDIGFLWPFILAYPVFPWYNTLTFMKVFLEELWDEDHKDNPTGYPAWLSNLGIHSLREECDRSNQLVLNKKGYLATRWGSVALTKTNSQKEFLKQMAKFDDMKRQIYTSNPPNSPDEQVGTWFMSYINTNSMDKVIGGLDKYVPKTDAARVELFNKDFPKFGNAIHDYQFGYTLDHFWSDYSIKEFIKKWFGVYSFEGVDEEVLKKCYLNYPTCRQLPVWSDIVEQTLNGG